MATHLRRGKSCLPKEWYEPKFGDLPSTQSRKPWLVDQPINVPNDERREDDGLAIQLEKPTSEERPLPLNKLFAREAYLNGRRDQITSTIERHEDWLRRTEQELVETRRQIAKAKGA